MLKENIKRDLTKLNDKKECSDYNERRNVNIENRINSFEELPLFLDVKDVKKILRLCLAKVYELFHSEGFPSKQFGRRHLISRSAFGVWMDNQKQSGDMSIG